jgi:uncharacterized membrane protein
VTGRRWARLLLLAAAASAFSLLTPFVRASAALAALPDWLEWYIKPPQGRSWFTMFPWAGLLVAGTIVGDLLDRARDAAAERRVLTWFGVGGLALFAISLAGSYLPSLYENTYFWTTSPSYFFLRIGFMTALIPAAWLWTRGRRPDRFSPMIQLGRTSLFIYWIHVEMVYGLLSWPLHRRLPGPVSVAAFVAFAALMLWASVAKDRWVERRRQRRTGAPVCAAGG